MQKFYISLAIKTSINYSQIYYCYKMVLDKDLSLRLTVVIFITPVIMFTSMATFPVVTLLPLTAQHFTGLKLQVFSCNFYLLPLYEMTTFLVKPVLPSCIKFFIFKICCSISYHVRLSSFVRRQNKIIPGPFFVDLLDSTLLTINIGKLGICWPKMEWTKPCEIHLPVSLLHPFPPSLHDIKSLFC